MRIDDEIKGSFSSEYHRALVNLQYTHSHIVNNLSNILAEHNVTRQQYNVLRILRGQYPNPAPVSLIKDRMLDKMSDASRIVDRLKKKGLIIKEVRQQDRRAADILISDERIPWSGHSGRFAVGEVYEQIKNATMSLVFVNTRSQAEVLFQELWTANEDGLAIALHHGSLAKEQRRKVEAARLECCSSCF